MVGMSRVLLALVAMATTIGCTSSFGANRTSLLPTPPVGPSLHIVATPQGPLEEVTVLRAIDGDTIEVQLEGRRARVRYIGINTPESVAPDRPIECFGKEAAARNRELVEGQRVRLEKDVSETDRFGRLLRYVWIQGELINARLVAEGYAQVSTFPPDVRYAEQLQSLQSEARASQRGSWGVCLTGNRP
jgi:micrococcal nuclease